MSNRPDQRLADPRVAVIVPCRDEALTVGPLVEAICRHLPQARVVVVDNASSDATAAKALVAGAEVMRVSRRGKGNAVRSAFDHIDADIYVMMDGDGTYDPAEAPRLVQRLVSGGLDMVVGARQGIGVDAGPRGHAFGNRLFNGLFSRLFGAEFTDIFSGYRVFSRRFVKSFPACRAASRSRPRCRSTPRCWDWRWARLRSPTAGAGRLEEQAFDASGRPADPARSADADQGGQALQLLHLLALLALGLSLAAGLPVVLEFLETGLVERQPTWVLSVSLGVIAVITFFSGGDPAFHRAGAAGAEDAAAAPHAQPLAAPRLGRQARVAGSGAGRQRGASHPARALRPTGPEVPPCAERRPTAFASWLESACRPSSAILACSAPAPRRSGVHTSSA
jgi:hypothetical protein